MSKTSVPPGDDGLPTHYPSVPSDEPTLPAGTQGELCLAENAAGALQQALQVVPDVQAYLTCLKLRDVLRSARLTGLTAMPTETWVAALRLSPHHPEAESQPDPETEARIRGHLVGRFIRGSGLLDRKIAKGGHNGIELLGEVSAVLTDQPVRSWEEGLRQTEGFLTAGPGGAPYVRTAPPGEPLVRAVLEWDRWVARAGVGPRLAKIAVAHLLLELLQPYPRANGHLARLFSSGEMVRQGVVRQPVLSLAPWLDDHADEYRTRIRAVVEGGPWWEWIEFFARGVGEQARRNLALIGRLDDLRTELTERVTGSRALREVLAALPTSPVTSIQVLAFQHGLKPKTAAQFTRRLVAEQVLRVVAEHPIKVFVCEEAMDVLTFDATVPRTDLPVLSAPDTNDR